MIKFYNSLTTKKESFKPIDSKHIKMYVCGPTVYNYIHIGNARSIIVFDTLFRLLKHTYKKVSYTRNITDIDDKIINKANKNNKEANDIALKYTKILHEDLSNINVLNPSYEPKATNHIEDIIQIIQETIKNGYAYEKEGNVLFDINKYKKYGTLVNLDKNKTLAGKRVEVEEYKINPEDFVLWKPSKKNEPYWNSPWGKGRPGWHVECSAMARKCLGEKFDIHGGGQDLKFPHHENEMAISSCVSCHDFSANYWLHNGFLTIKDEKMSKSLNNFITLRNATQEYGASVLKIAMLLSQYRQPLNFNNKLIQLANNICKKIYLSVYTNFGKNITLNENFENEDFIKALQDDLNTPLAFTHLQKGLTTNSLQEIAKQLDILGLNIDMICLNILQLSLSFIKKSFCHIEPTNNIQKDTLSTAINNIITTITHVFTPQGLNNSFYLTHCLHLLHSISKHNLYSSLNTATQHSLHSLHAVFSNKKDLESFTLFIKQQLQERLIFKDNKNYSKADNIRNNLALKYGIKIIDNNKESSWTIE